MSGQVEDGRTDTAESRNETVLAKKLKKTLQLKLENDAETVDALKELSSFFLENNLKTRRNLRGQIERRNLEINRDFLNAFKSVKESLDEIHSNVKGMSDSCKSMQGRLEKSKLQTTELMLKTTELQSEGTKLATHKLLSERMREKLSLTNKEVQELKGGTEKHRIGSEFFDVLDKIQRIHSESKILLAAGHQTTGLSVMERMEEFRELAMDRLYRWAQAAVRNIEIGENSENLSKGLYHLQEKEVYFNHVIEEFISSRRQLIVRQFLDALTVGGPGGTPRPIEMHAHDPTRYVGDMLAWLHQICPGEAENINHILKLCHKTDKVATSNKILSGITEGVCRPLKSRIEQILVSESSAIILYKLTNLIRFYESTISDVLRCSSALSGNLMELQQLSYSQFLSLLQTSVTHQLARTGEGDGTADLSPSLTTSTLLGLLRDVLSGHSVVDTSQSDLPVIVRAVVDPLTLHLQETAQRLPRVDAAVYLLNNLHPLRSTLSLYQSDDKRLDELNKRMESCLLELVKEQTGYILVNLQLSSILNIIAKNDGSPLASVPGTHRQAVATSMAKLDNLLGAPDLFLLPSTRLLVSSQHRKRVRVGSNQELLAAYTLLHQAIVDEKNGYEAGILNKSPEQIKQLLQL